MGRARRSLLVLTACAVASLGCPDRHQSSLPLDAGGEGDAGRDVGGAQSSDAAVSQALRVWITSSADDGGRLSLASDSGTFELEPTRVLELRFTPRPKNPRIRLFDWNDRLVESDDTVLTLDGPDFGYRIDLPEPLQPGRTYILGIDSEVGPKLLDQAGDPLEDVRVPLKVLGEPKPDKTAPPHKRRRR